MAIKKNLSDQEMMVNCKDIPSFENFTGEEEIPAAPKNKSAAKGAAPDPYSAFFTPELQEKVGKALLEIKVKLYKEGIVDYTLKVSRDGNQVLLTAVPVPANKKIAPRN